MTNPNNQNHQAQIYVVTAILLVIATVGVALRLFARRISSAHFWWDDYTIVVALIFYYGLTVTYWLQAAIGGSGLHTVEVGGPVDASKQESFFKIFMAIQILYFCTSVTFKTSLILLYDRIFGIVRPFHYALIATWCIVASYFLTCVFTAIFECHPVSFYWNKSPPPTSLPSRADGTCINETQFYRWNGVANLLIDLLILSLSVPMIWRLKIPLRQKASLTAIFLLGAFVFIASVVRVTSFERFRPDDLTYTGVAAAVWTDVEQSIGIVCACLPCLRPLFGWLMGDRTPRNTTWGSSARGDPSSTMTTARSINLAKLGGAGKKHYHHHHRLGSLTATDRDLEEFAKLEGNAAMVGTTTTRATAEGAGVTPQQDGILLTQSVNK